MNLKKAKTELFSIDESLGKIGINYSLVGGSLLGCFRHKGFIPWDDDIDILVEESDLYRLLELFPEKVSLVHSETITSQHTGFFQNFAVWSGGVKIDIWPWKEHNGSMQTFIGSFSIADWFPVRRAKFEDIVVSVPNNPISIIEYTFGKNWDKKIKKTNSNLSIWCVDKSEIEESVFLGEIPKLEDVFVS